MKVFFMHKVCLLGIALSSCLLTRSAQGLSRQEPVNMTAVAPSTSTAPSPGEQENSLKKESKIAKIAREAQDFEHKSKQAYRSPALTTSVIVEVYKQNECHGILLIERCNPPYGKALPGGFVEYGESIEDAARREIKEECGVSITDLQQFHVYSLPNRDPRFHVVDMVQCARTDNVPEAGSDASKAFVCPFDKIPWKELTFDHSKIIQNYLDWKNGRSESCPMPQIQ